MRVENSFTRKITRLKRKPKPSQRDPHKTKKPITVGKTYFIMLPFYAFITITIPIQIVMKRQLYFCRANEKFMNVIKIED
jgi:hypothetical protein